MPESSKSLLTRMEGTSVRARGRQQEKQFGPQNSVRVKALVSQRNKRKHVRAVCVCSIHFSFHQTGVTGVALQRLQFTGDFHIRTLRKENGGHVETQDSQYAAATFARSDLAEAELLRQRGPDPFFINGRHRTSKSREQRAPAFDNSQESNLGSSFRGPHVLVFLLLSLYTNHQKGYP